jgi:hypothetical protein
LRFQDEGGLWAHGRGHAQADEAARVCGLVERGWEEPEDAWAAAPERN